MKFSEIFLEILEKQGDDWVIMSKKTPGKKLGTYKSKKRALKRIAQIEYFKNRG